MNYEIVPLEPAHLDKLMERVPFSALAVQLRLAYFTPGSAALCLLTDGEPVFAGGLVNLQWNRAEAWILPTPWFRSHVKTCLRSLRNYLPKLAGDYGFTRVQATCVRGVSASIFSHLGFSFEGRLMGYGPFGETCEMWSRIFELRILEVTQ